MRHKKVKKKYDLKVVYELICKKISTSVFKILGFNFFIELISKGYLHAYVIMNNKEITSIITVINYENYKKLSKFTLIYLFNNPFLILKNFFPLMKSYSKNIEIKLNKNYLHLLHLVIFKEKFKNFSLKSKDKIFDNIFKKILRTQGASSIFLCFEKGNKRAFKYYTRNNFKFFFKVKDLLYFKKKYKI